MKYKFEIPITPKTKKNHRPIFVNKKTGKHFIGKDYSLKKYEKDCWLILTNQKNLQGISTPIDFELKGRFQFHFQGKCKADIDNLLTSTFDVLQEAEIVQNDSLFKLIDQLVIIENTGLPDRTIVYIDRLKLL